LAPKILLTAFFKAQQPFWRHLVDPIRGSDPSLRKVAELRITALKHLKKEERRSTKTFRRKKIFKTL
jgi:hypothetical protein